MANVAPEVDLNGGGAGQDNSVSFTEGDPATPLAPDATASDPDSPDLEGGSLTVAITAGGTADDLLVVTGGDFIVEEADLYYQGIAIGSISGGTDGSTPLVVNFNASATPEIAQALIRSIAYVNYSSAPAPGEREISFFLTDGDGGTSVARIATVDVTAVDSPPVAQDDMIAVDENVVGRGTLFGDNGNGADSDPDGPPLQIAEVNGSSANVGRAIILDSGARLIVYADGSYAYNPNGRFDTLTDGRSGAVNTSAIADYFTYTLAGGGTALVTVTVNGVAGPGDRLMGDEGDNAITGTPGPDVFVLDQGGNDQARGLGGNDIFYFGGALTADDVVDGGDGYDTLVLQGDYSFGLVLDGDVTGIEAISMLAGSNTAFAGEKPRVAAALVAEFPAYDYDITTHDSNFAAGLRAKINGAALLEGEDLTFDGSAETDASFLIYGGRGLDHLTGGALNDIFFFDIGRFAAGDQVIGGAGYDGLFLRGNYTLDFNTPGFETALNGMENLTLTSATDERYARGGGTEFDYDIVLADSMVAQGGVLTVSGVLLTAAETMAVDGSLELDGALRLLAGKSDDVLKGGGQNDLLLGNAGADTLTGNGGADVFRYDSTADSTANSRDLIDDFTPGTDKIDLGRIDADSEAAGDQAFTWIGSAAFSGSAGELRAYDNDGTWIVEGDVDGDGIGDFILALSLAGRTPLGASDFVL